MGSNGPFGFDPEEFDRVAREAGEGLRDALDGISRFFTTSGERAPWATIFDEFSRYTRPKTEPETTGETGDGVERVVAQGNGIDREQAQGRHLGVHTDLLRVVDRQRRQKQLKPLVAE